MIVVPIRSVDEYYDLYNHKKTWTKIHVQDYIVKATETETTTTPVTVFKDAYGNTYVEEGMCVVRHTVIDIRGWTIDWLDEDPYAIALVPDWIEQKDFNRRFKLWKVRIMTEEDLKEEFEWRKSLKGGDKI